MEDGNLRKAGVLLFLISLVHTFIFVIVPIYLSASGLTGYEIGVLVSIYAVTTVFVSFPTGFVNDRWTVRLTMVTGVILTSAFLAGLSLADSFLAFIPLYFIGGLGWNLSEVSVRTVFYKARTEGKDGGKFGSYHLVRICGAALGVLAGGVMVFFLDFSLAMLWLGVIYLLLIPLISFHSQTSSRIRLGQYRKDILNRRVLLIGAVILLFATHWGAETTSYGLFLKNNLNLDLFMIGIYNAGSVIFLGISAYLFGRRIDSGKANLRNIFFAGMLISGVFHILHTIPVLPLSFAFRVLHEVGDGMAMVSMFFWISRLFGRERIGGNSSLMFTLTLIGQVAGSLIYGPMGYLMGYHVPLIISGMVAIFCAFLMIAFLRIYGVRHP